MAIVCYLRAVRVDSEHLPNAELNSEGNVAGERA